jgi:Fungal specific transcription factor domain
LTAEKEGSVPGNDNETYEWDEGGDEKELGTDAMGAASTRDYKPGFFGGSSTLSFMEGIKAAISNSTNVSPSDTATPLVQTTPHPRPRRSQSARIPVNDVDALVLPPRRTADHLVDLYFKYVHTLYPWLHEPSFRTAYEALWDTSAKEDDPLFYCILNLVLALGCQFSTLFESSIHSGDTFFNRAKTLLGFSIFDVGTLQVVQALLLMGSYLQSTNRPNRCWNVLGMGIRVAQGLGLHIERKTGDVVERETRRRAWWGCVLMDR